MDTKNKIIVYKDKMLNAIISQIVRIANPDKIILFGSRATGAAKNDSDYDLCVIKKNIKKKREFASKIRSGINALVPIDIIVNTPVQFNELKDKWYYVQYDIAKDGQTVYEK